MAEKILMIALSPTMESGILSKWIKKEGDTIASGDILCEVETDKATMDYEATTEGTLLKILKQEGEKASIGEPIAIVGEEGEDIEALILEIGRDQANPLHDRGVPANGQEAAITPKEKQSPQGIIKASPLARKLAKDHGLQLSNITGTGPDGRIIKRDIEKAIAQAGQAASVPAPAPNKAASDEIIPVSGKRKIIAERLSQSKFTAPHYYLKVTIAMDPILQARKELNAARKTKVSFNAFLIKFIAEALKKHPMVNASWNGDTILMHRQIDIGLAVAQPDGLITPVVRDCGSKGIIEIDHELQILIEKALNNSLLPDEYTGATFTVSNLGSFGIEEFTAIINPPGSAILAVGEIRKEAVVNVRDEVVIQSNMKVTLSCDHRVIDGAVGAAFLKELKDIMENPIRVLY